MATRGYHGTAAFALNRTALNRTALILAINDVSNAPTLEHQFVVSRIMRESLSPPSQVDGECG